MNFMTKHEIGKLINGCEEDIQLQGSTACTCLYYKLRDGKKFFLDSEIAITDYEEYLSLLNPKEREQFIQYVEMEKAKGNTFEFYNIVYNDEKIDLVSLQDLRQLLSDLYTHGFGTINENEYFIDDNDFN